MTGRERFLTAINNQQPDRLPCQVHCWMDYYLKTYLGGRSQLEAYEYFGMDPVFYTAPSFEYDPRDLANWDTKVFDLGKDEDGNTRTRIEITTPKGVLSQENAVNCFTSWLTKPMVESERDFEIWNEYIPVPIKVDWTPVIEAKKLVGENGIVRGGFYDFGQGSPWQSYVGYVSTLEPTIYQCFDNPEYVHYIMKSMLDKKLRVIDIAGKFEFDLVETGGGAGSSTVISPDLHREFCLPYDKIQHEAIHNAGGKAVYHLCGGLMPLLETVVENGADALETMTPVSMGGDCDLNEADERVGDKLCFIGGFDQGAGFEKGTKEYIEKSVEELFHAKKHGGFIISPSDHFFFGDPENIRYFVEAVKRCKY